MLMLPAVLRSDVFALDIFALIALYVYCMMLILHLEGRKCQKKPARRSLALIFDMQFGCVVYGHHQVFILMNTTD